MEKLVKIQQKLKAPKNQYNAFGKYKYRNAEDILEAVKPLLAEEGLLMTITDEIIEVGSRIYVKATVKVFEGENMFFTSAFARESETQKGMNDSQITGSASSYARKYALNGMFCIDDTKDADSMDNREEKKEPKKEDKSNKFNDIIKKFNDIGLILGGSYGLKLHGVDLGRKISDIDLISTTKKIIRTDIERIQKIDSYKEFKGSDDALFSFKIDNVKFDVLYGGANINHIIIDGIKVQDEAQIIKAKQKYADKKVEKHVKDIKNYGSK